MYVTIFSASGITNEYTEVSHSPKRLTLGHVVAASTSHKRLESEWASGWSVQTRNAHNLILQRMSSDNHMALNAALAQQRRCDDVGTGCDTWIW